MTEIMNDAFDKHVARLAREAEKRGHLVEYVAKNYTYTLTILGEKHGEEFVVEAEFHCPRGYLVLKKAVRTIGASITGLRSIPQVIDFI